MCRIIIIYYKENLAQQENWTILTHVFLHTHKDIWRDKEGVNTTQMTQMRKLKELQEKT